MIIERRRHVDRTESRSREILLISDTNYATYPATTIASTLKNTNEDDVLRFHLVDGGLTETDLKKIEQPKGKPLFQVELLEVIS